MRFYDQEAWEMVKNVKVEGYTLEFTPSVTQLDNYGLFRHEGEFVFPLKEAPQPALKPPVIVKNSVRKTRQKTISKATNARAKAKD